MKKILVLLLIAFVAVSGITYAQSTSKLTTNALAKQIASALFNAYLEIEYMKVGGKDNFELTQKIYQSEQFKVTQKDSLEQALEQFKGTKKSLVLPKIDKSSTTKELISTVRLEFMKKVHQLEANKVGGPENYTMVLGIYASQKFKKEQKESLVQAHQQFDGSNKGGNIIISDINPEVSSDGFTRGVLTKEQLTSVLSGAVFTGKTNSAIVFIEYSDIECPFCQRQFSTKTVETIIEQHHIKTIFKNFPLGFHSTAQKAAEAISCAGKQGKLIEFKNALFSAAIDSTDQRPTIKVITATAKKLQLNETTFTKCLSDGQSATQVQSEMNEGSTVFGVAGTPGNVLLNTETGKYVVVAGAYPAESFDPVIAELTK